MGFRIPDTVVLTFEGSFEGLEIRCRLGLPFREQAEIWQMTKGIDLESNTEAFLEIFRVWFDHVQPGWNVEDDAGNPVPITADAITGMLPGEILIQIMPKWREALGIPAPLAAPSTSGGTTGDNLTRTLANQSESLPS